VQARSSRFLGRLFSFRSEQLAHGEQWTYTS
jgi:hypothetical protein